jgi:hypothetical protein
MLRIEIIDWRPDKNKAVIRYQDGDKEVSVDFKSIAESRKRSTKGIRISKADVESALEHTKSRVRCIADGKIRDQELSKLDTKEAFEAMRNRLKLIKAEENARIKAKQDFDGIITKVSDIVRGLIDG